jgi:two-component system OmpR family sensor kinase
MRVRRKVRDTRLPHDAALSQIPTLGKEALVRLPLRWRLAGVSLGLLLVLTIGLGTLMVLYERGTMLGNQAAALRSAAQVAIRGGGLVALVPPDTVPPPAGAAPVDVDARVGLLTARLAGATTSVAVYLPDGALIGTSDYIVQAPRAAQAAATTVQDASTNAHSADWYTLLTNPEGRRQVATLLPVMAGGQTVLVLQIATPSAPIDQTVTATAVMLGLGVLLALAIAALVTPPLVRAALRPLEEMERTTALISSGDELAMRLNEPPTQDEIGRLARSFNHMVARLEAAFARQKRFVADVSHELRTPLTALGGGMEMLLIGAEAGDPEASRRLLRGMYAEVERMRRLAEDLLTLTRLDEGHIELRVERLDPGALLEGVCEQAQHLARGQEIRCDVESPLPAIEVDADRIRQVLLNLVDNALKFTPPPGTVTLRARREVSDGVILEVEDSGRGIPADALPHVFDRFYRADPARARMAGQVGGSGLGLAIAKSLVRANGGRIAIASTEGRGTSVVVRFPALLDQRASHSGKIPLVAPADR